MLFPVTPEAVQAETSSYDNAVDLTNDAVAPRIIMPTPSVGLNVPASIEFAEVAPAPAGSTTTASAKLEVTTTDSAAYSLYLYGTDGNVLRSLNPDTTDVVAATTSATTVEELARNTWGYALLEGEAADATLTALPTDGTAPVKSKDTSATDAADDVYTLMFGAKVDSAIPSGTYTGAVTIAVVAEPRAATLGDLDTMQEMTAQICADSAENETKRLEDIRDGRLYWVAKLRDGNCWMTQNLDYVIAAGGITGEEATQTDLADGAAWDASSAFPPRATEAQGTMTSSTEVTGTYSWDLGMYVKADPDAFDQYCGTVSDSDVRIKTLADASCEAAGWVNVESGYTALTEERTDEAAVDEAEKTYDAHYLVGNRYQWNAATAGTGGNVAIEANAVSSICPAGWELPSGGTASAATNQFYKLVNAYGLAAAASGSGMTQAPLYFLPGGRVFLGQLGDTGYSGLYWSATLAATQLTAYYLDFFSGAVDAAGAREMHGGQAVRCVAAGI